MIARAATARRLTSLAVVLVWAATGHLVAQQGPRPVKPAYDDGNVEVLQVQGSVHLVAGAGANITVQADPDGLLLVDTSVAAMSDKVLAAIRTISDKPIRHIINTSADEHHTSGNESLSNAGRNVSAGIGGQGGREPARLEGAPVIAHEQVLHRMSGLKGEPARVPLACGRTTRSTRAGSNSISPARSSRCCTCRQRTPTAISLSGSVSRMS